MTHGINSAVAGLTHPSMLICFSTAYVTIRYYLSRLAIGRPTQWWPLLLITIPLLGLVLFTHFAAWQVLSLYLSATVFLSVALLIVYVVSLPVTVVALTVSLVFSTAHVLGGTVTAVQPVDYSLWRLHLTATAAAVGRLVIAIIRTPAPATQQDPPRTGPDDEPIVFKDQLDD